MTGIVLGAAYMLWLFQRTMFGALENPKNANLPDLSARELTTLVPIVIMCFWIGLYPSPFLSRTEASVNYVLARVHKTVTTTEPYLSESTSPAAGQVEVAPEPGHEGSVLPVKGSAASHVEGSR